MVLKFFLFIVYCINFCFAEVKVENINEDFVSNLLNTVFKGVKKNFVLNTDSNKTNIFNKGKKLFEIETLNTIIEKDFSINSPQGIKLKVFDDSLKEIINIVCEQFYESREKHSLVFFGNVEINLLNYKTKITTDCLIYDFDSDVFFNVHKTDINIEDHTYINGISIFLKRDLSYLKVKSPTIINSNQSN